MVMMRSTSRVVDLADDVVIGAEQPLCRELTADAEMNGEVVILKLRRSQLVPLISSLDG